MMRRGRLRYTERGREALLLFSSEALGTFIFPQRKEGMDIGEATTVCNIIKGDNLFILVLNYEIVKRTL